MGGSAGDGDRGVLAHGESVLPAEAAAADGWTAATWSGSQRGRSAPMGASRWCCGGMVRRQLPGLGSANPFFPDARPLPAQRRGHRVRTAAEFEREERGFVRIGNQQGHHADDAQHA